MAVVKPFRALRYDEAMAGPLETLVAPPYDVISDEQREELRARSPYNVVRLTLPDSEEDAARELEEWRASGVLVEEPPAVWALEQDYVGPDGVARTRFGLVASLKVEPYATGTVLPHERTHARPEGGPAAPAARDARPARADLPALRRPGTGRAARPRAGPRGRGREALADRRPVGRPRVRRQAAPDRRRPPPLRDRGRLPRGGGHPGERADARRARLDRAIPGSRSSPRTGSSRSPSTSKASRTAAAEVTEVTRDGSRDVPARRGCSTSSSWTPSATKGSRTRRRRGGGAARSRRRGGHRLPAAADADRGRVHHARRGEVLPQKTTYFFPKLISGLLFHPL